MDIFFKKNCSSAFKSDSPTPCTKMINVHLYEWSKQERYADPLYI